MKLLHPFMPFLSEEIWQKLPKSPNAPTSLCIAAWLTQDARVSARNYMDDPSTADFLFIQDIIRAVRSLRAEAKLTHSQKPAIMMFLLDEQKERRFGIREGATFHIHPKLKQNLLQFVNLADLQVMPVSEQRPQNALSASLPGVEIFLPLEGLIDVPRETARLQKEIDEREKELARVEAKLSNPQFTDKAPPAVVAKEEAKRAEIGAALEKLRERLAALN